MYGLIIKKKWLDLIMSGQKTLEIRGSRTSHERYWHCIMSNSDTNLQNI